MTNDELAARVWGQMRAQYIAQGFTELQVDSDPLLAAWKKDIEDSCEAPATLEQSAQYIVRSLAIWRQVISDTLWSLQMGSIQKALVPPGAILGE